MYVIACNDTSGTYYWRATGFITGTQADAPKFKYREQHSATVAMLDAVSSFADFRFSGSPYWLNIESNTATR